MFSENLSTATLVARSLIAVRFKYERMEAQVRLLQLYEDFFEVIRPDVRRAQAVLETPRQDFFDVLLPRHGSEEDRCSIHHYISFFYLYE
jgi:hypothetical protein